MDDLEERLRQPAVFAEPAESQRCHLVMQEAADRIRTYRKALERIARGEYDGMEVAHLNAKGCRQIAIQALKG